MRSSPPAAARSMRWSPRCACSRTIRNSTRAPARRSRATARSRPTRRSWTARRQRVGAVAAVPDLGCAIALARAVLEAGEHVILAGPAAWRVRGRGRHRAGAAGIARHRARARATREPRQLARRAQGGTVGAVARDLRGQFAAATSTGGIVGKRAAASATRRFPAPARGPMRAARSRRPATARRSCASRSRERSRCASRRYADARRRYASRCASSRSITGGSAGVIAIDARSRRRRAALADDADRLRSCATAISHAQHGERSPFIGRAPRCTRWRPRLRHAS